MGTTFAIVAGCIGGAVLFIALVSRQIVRRKHEAEPVICNPVSTKPSTVRRPARVTVSNGVRGATDNPAAIGDRGP